MSNKTLNIGFLIIFPTCLKIHISMSITSNKNVLLCENSLLSHHLDGDIFYLEVLVAIPNTEEADNHRAKL